MLQQPLQGQKTYHTKEWSYSHTFASRFAAKVWACYWNSSAVNSLAIKALLYLKACTVILKKVNLTASFVFVQLDKPSGGGRGGISYYIEVGTDVRPEWPLFQTWKLSVYVFILKYMTLQVFRPPCMNGQICFIRIRKTTFYSLKISK